MRSGGQFTIVELAKEAQVSRARIYEHHPDIIASFRARTGHAPPPPAMQALQGELDTLRAKNDTLAAENRALHQRIRVLSALITELTIQSDSTKVIDRGPKPIYKAHP